MSHLIIPKDRDNPIVNVLQCTSIVLSPKYAWSHEDKWALTFNMTCGSPIIWRFENEQDRDDQYEEIAKKLGI